MLKGTVVLVFRPLFFFKEIDRTLSNPYSNFVCLQILFQIRGDIRKRTRTGNVSDFADAIFMFKLRLNFFTALRSSEDSQVHNKYVL
jgi:hypothetical protein